MAITINDVRFSYCNLFEAKPPINNPTGEPKYSLTVLVPKTNTAAKAAIDQAINQAIELGVGTKWNGVRPPMPSLPIHDGDGVRPSDGQPYGEECKGCWVMNATSKRKPGIVNRRVQPILDPAEIYSGMWAIVDLNFGAYEYNGNRGISCYLNNVQKVRDDEALGGSAARPESVFAAVEDDDDDLGL